MRTSTSRTLEHFYFKLITIGMVLVMLTPLSEARTRTVCAGEHYNGTVINCGGHLEAECASGPICDANHNSYGGPPLPKVIDCPHIFEQSCLSFWPYTCITLVDENIPDVTINNGCYDQLPTCNNCGGHLQPPCPVEAEPVCGGCDEGHLVNPVTGLCQIPDQPGIPCNLDIGCGEGLSCGSIDATCFLDQPAQSGDFCGPGRACDEGLECTLGLECATAGGGHEGETCDVFSPCSDGLYCAPGLPQRCESFGKPGERCSIFEPCAEGAVCAQAYTGISMCYPNFEAEPISTEQCERFFSEEVTAEATATGSALTRASGFGLVSGTALSISKGVAYGPEGEYGCFTSECYGLEPDLAVELFHSNGTYDTYETVDGESVVLVVEGQIPGSILNVGVASVNFGDEQGGTEFIFGPGLGASPLPVSVGGYGCETLLNTVYGDTGGGVFVAPPITSPPGPAPVPAMDYGALFFDGTDDVVALNDTSLLDAQSVGDEFTVELWLSLSSSAQTSTVLSNVGEYQIGLVAGELVYRLATSSSNWTDLVFTNITEVKQPGWHHVALSYGSGGYATVHVNGRAEHVKQGFGVRNDQVSNDDRLLIGNSADGSSAFRGRIDDVRLWADRRSSAQLLLGANTAQALDDGTLVAGWSLEESGGSELADHGVHAIDITLPADNTTPLRVGSERLIRGGALLFDGVDDLAALDNVDRLASLDFANTLTLEAWVHPLGDGSHPNFGGIIISKEGEYYIGRYPDGRLYYALANVSPGWSLVPTTAVIPLNAWSHVALTYDGAAGEVAVYLNGVLEQTIANSTGALGDFHGDRNQLRFGSRQNDEITGVPTRFNGLLDEVRIWSVARDAASIATDYDQVLNPDVYPALRGYWRFDEGESSLLFDSRDRGLHVQMGLGNSWSMPLRQDAAAYADYPRSLLTPVCSAANCLLDPDGDQLSNYTDNCQFHANDNQIDADADGFGNACDPDFDNNGVVNFLDIVTFQNAFLSNDLLTDLNTDGAVNFLDFVILQSFFLKTPGPSSNN